MAPISASQKLKGIGTMAKNPKRYNLKDAAAELGVHRLTLYYWLKKGWITVKRDYRNLPVLTADDLRAIRKWRSVLREDTKP